MKNFLFPVCIVLALLSFSCSSTKKTSRTVQHIFENSPEFKQGFAGLVIYDPQTRKTIFEKNGNKYFIPASNIKLLSFYTSLKTIGDSIPAIHYTTHGDSLIFQGTGDPSLLYGDYNSEKVLQFLSNSDKKLFLLRSNFKESYYGPGWAWDDYNDSYAAERNSFPIYGNTVKFKFEAGLDSPKIEPVIFQDSIKPIKTEALNQAVIRDISENSFQLNKLKNQESFTQTVPFITSEVTSARLLSDTLHKKVTLLDQKPANIKLNNTLYSVASDSLYKKMLQESDNFIAEQLLLISAEKLSDTLKTSIAIDHAQQYLLNDLPDHINWYDGSGLTRYNLATPASMAKLVEKITDEIGETRFKKLLPSGGATGNLKNDYKANQPYIYAKTGTLKNNHALSGLLLTKTGKTLYFSFMNSNYTIPSAQLKKAMERIFLAVYNQY